MREKIAKNVFGLDIPDLREKRLKYAVYGMGLVLGFERVERLQFVEEINTAGAEEYLNLNHLLLAQTWLACARRMFRLVDPTGYQSFAQASGGPDSDSPEFPFR